MKSLKKKRRVQIIAIAAVALIASTALTLGLAGGALISTLPPWGSNQEEC